VKPVYIVFHIVAVLVLAQAGAAALDANIEEAFLHIIAADDVDPPWDPNTRDKDENGIVDLAHIRLFDTILREDTAPFHSLVLGTYTLNHLQVQRDNTLGSKCILLELIYHFTCDEYERFAAATFTMNEPVGVEDMVAALAGQANIHIDLNDYHLNLGYLLNAAGDLDLDGYTNLEEYEAVCGNIDAFIDAAMDVYTTPETVPCCRDCPLVIIQQPQGTWTYTGASHTFTIEVTGVDGEVHYQWVKNNYPIGTDSNTLALTNLQPEDSGKYQCVVGDEAETILSDITDLQVADHMAITQQPVGATLEEGQGYTLSLHLSGGLGNIHYYWMKDGVRVGKDNNELLFTALTLPDSGIYWCRVTDFIEEIVSEQVVLTVLPASEGEGVLEGEEEGLIEGEGMLEGEEEGLIEGEGMLEGEEEGQIEGEGMLEGEEEGQIEGEEEGLIEGEEEGLIEGEEEGLIEGEEEGLIEGEGMLEGEEEGEEEGHMQVIPGDSSVMFFDTTAIKGLSHKTVHVENIGNGPLDIFARMIDGTAIRLEGSAMIRLDPGIAKDLVLTFTPTENRWYSDGLLLDGGGQRVLIYLEGEGAKAPLLSCSGQPNPRGSFKSDAMLMAFTGLALVFLRPVKRKIVFG